MIKVDELFYKDSCLNRAANNEPIFVLRANDPLAANIVYQWACAYVKSKQSQFDGMSSAQEDKAHRAFELAKKMKAWRPIDDIGQNKTTVHDRMPYFRIVETDNFGGDYPAEKFVENLPGQLSEEQARRICDAIMTCVKGNFHPRFWHVVAADYKLQPGFEP